MESEEANIEYGTSTDDANIEYFIPPEDTRHILLMHSPVVLRTGRRRKMQHLFLFSDLLLISNTKYVYSAHSPYYHSYIFTNPHCKRIFISWKPLEF